MQQAEDRNLVEDFRRVNTSDLVVKGPGGLLGRLGDFLSAAGQLAIPGEGLFARVISVILGDTLNVLNFYKPGDTTGAGTDDSLAAGRALAAAYVRGGGEVVFPNRQGGYNLRSPLVVDTSQYPALGGAITLRLGGNTFTQWHNGWGLDIVTNYFGGVNGGNFGTKQVVVEGGGAVFFGNPGALGAIRLTDAVGCTVRGLSLRGYTAGGFVFRGAWTAATAYAVRDVLTDAQGRTYMVQTAFTSGGSFDATNLALGGPGVGLLLTATVTVAQPAVRWSEENLIESVFMTSCLTGFATRGQPGTSFLGTICRHITIEGQINNATLFELNGGPWDAVFEKCGGFIDQPPWTGGQVFYLNGSYNGTTFLSCWVDSGQDSSGANAAPLSALNQVVFGPDYTTFTPWFPTFVGCNLLRPPNWRSKTLWLGPVPRPDGSGVSANALEVLEGARNYFVGTWYQAGFTAGVSGTTLTVTAITGSPSFSALGVPGVGQQLYGAGVTSGTTILSLGTATTSNPLGTYNLSVGSSVAPGTALYTASVPSDGNSGLTGQSPLASPQTAINLIYNTLNLASNTVTIQLTGGATYGPISLSGLPTGIGQGQLIINGDAGAGVVLDGGSAGNAVTLGAGARLSLANVQVQTANGSGCFVSDRASLSLGAMKFGACSDSYVKVLRGGLVAAQGNWTCLGNAAFGVTVGDTGSLFQHNSGTIDATGRAFSGNWLSVGGFGSYVENNPGGYIITGSTGSKGFVFSGGFLSGFGVSGLLSLYPGNSNVFVDAPAAPKPPGYAY